MAEIYHALGLNMHQPPGNLLALHNSNERWEARQILWCYDRPTRMIEGYEDVAKLHISFSGTLLKQLEDPGIRETFQDVVDIEDLLTRYKRSNIEFVGTGLYHPVYPLIPQSDDRLLRAETSCNFFWGSRWVHRSFDDLEQTYYLLDTAMALISEKKRTYRKSL